MNWSLLLIEELFDIAVPLEDVDHLEAVVATAEKNHIAVDGEAAQIVTEFWPFPAKGAGEHGELTHCSRSRFTNARLTVRFPLSRVRYFRISSKSRRADER